MIAISVIIPVFNEAATIRRCLESLLKQTVPAVEVIIVDNRCTDDTVAIAAATKKGGLPLRIVQQSAVQGLIPTRNCGFDNARGQVLARIDADTIVDADWIEQLALCFADEDVAATSGPVRYYDFPFRAGIGYLDDHVRRHLQTLSRRHPFLLGCNMAIRRDAWQSIRSDVCTDPEDVLHEDLDLAIHLAHHQLRVTYSPTLRAAISARRLNSSRTAFNDYTRRLDRTYTAHGLTQPALHATGTVLRLAYPTLHRIHTRTTNQPHLLLTPRVGSPPHPR